MKGKWRRYTIAEFRKFGSEKGNDSLRGGENPDYLIIFLFFLPPINWTRLLEAELLGVGSEWDIGMLSFGGGKTYLFI